MARLAKLISCVVLKKGQGMKHVYTYSTARNSYYCNKMNCRVHLCPRENDNDPKDLSFFHKALSTISTETTETSKLEVYHGEK